MHDLEWRCDGPEEIKFAFAISPSIVCGTASTALNPIFDIITDFWPTEPISHMV